MGLRDQILSCDDLPREKVAVPEWGCDVWVRCLTGEERDAYDSAMYEAQESGGREALARVLRARLLAYAICDEAGKTVFQPGDWAVINRKSSVALGRLYGVAQRLNAIGEAAVEELAGKS